MRRFGASTHGASSNVLPNVFVHGGPEKTPADEVKYTVDTSMSSDARGVGPGDDNRSERGRDIEGPIRKSFMIGFLTLSLEDFGFNVPG